LSNDKKNLKVEKTTKMFSKRTKMKLLPKVKRMNENVNTKLRCNELPDDILFGCEANSSPVE